MDRYFLIVTTTMSFYDLGHNKNMTQVIALGYPGHYKTVHVSLILPSVPASFR
jgi:hypothetical protein